MVTNLAFLSLRRGGRLLGWPVLAEVGKLFAIGQVVAEDIHYWTHEPNKRGPIPVLSTMNWGS